MRLIDADHLRETLSAEEDEFRASHSEDGMIEDEFSDGVLSTVVSMYRFIGKEKTVDAVPVVRCKDCVYLEKLKYGYTCAFYDNGDVELDDYCSRGLRNDGKGTK